VKDQAATTEILRYLRISSGLGTKTAEKRAVTPIRERKGQRAHMVGLSLGTAASAASFSDDMAAAGHQVVAAGKCSVDKAPCGPAPRKDPKKPSFSVNLPFYPSSCVTVAEQLRRCVTPMAFWSSFVNAWITLTRAGSRFVVEPAFAL